jgi:putative Holliday junction resolvase
LGDVRIGIALSDPMGIIASALEVYNRVEMQKDLEYIAHLTKQHQVDTIVVGLPKNMDGTEGPRAQITRQFGEDLKKLVDCKVSYLDERLSSVSAERLLIEADMRRDKRKTVIDKVAASIILQNYLDIHR